MRRPAMQSPHATTVLGVRHQGKVVLASDGQVTLGQTVVKHQARKVRRLYHDRVLAGFAGTAADGFALFSRFESKLEEHRGNLERAAVELARDWRTDRALAPARGHDARRRHARDVSAVRHRRSDRAGRWRDGDWVGRAVRDGGGARARPRTARSTRARIVEQAMAIAADICIYTNTRLVLEEL